MRPERSAKSAIIQPRCQPRRCGRCGVSIFATRRCRWQLSWLWRSSSNPIQLC